MARFAALIVRSIVQLGNVLGKHVVAEGVETSAQFDQLRKMGCASGQGYHLSRPLAPEQVAAMLEHIAAPRRRRAGAATAFSSLLH